MSILIRVELEGNQTILRQQAGKNNVNPLSQRN